MSFFSSIGNFFKKLFGKDAKTVQAILTNIDVLYKEAQPIVAALAVAVSIQDTLNPTAASKKVRSVLDIYVKDSAAVDAWVVKNSGLSTANLLANAAVFALSVNSGVTVVKDLQLAVQLAYAVYSSFHPASTGNAQVESLGKVIK